MEKKTVYPFGSKQISRVQTKSEMNYVKDGKLFVGAGSESVLVTAESDLDNLEGLTPGSIAYTAGFGNMWQLGADGTWVAV